MMPRLSDSMTEGVIVTWLKQDGETVERGEDLVEIETDKATATYESDAAGVLSTLAEPGTTVPVGEVIARLRGASDAEEPEPGPAAPGTSRRPSASPLAKRLAREQGVDLASITGSGRGGRIEKADVEAVLGTTTGGDGRRGEIVTLTRTQTLIAERTTAAKATIPEFTVTTEVDAEALLTVREQLREHADPPPSLNDFVIKAAALALRQHPRANSSYRDGRLELHRRVNVGIAVAQPGAITVPTVFDADEQPLGEIARQTRALASRVRDGTITPPELADATFTVSNLGMFGVTRFNAIINSPQAAILAVGAMIPRAVPDREGTLHARHIMELTVTADHRILYGSDVAEFLATIRALLERPDALLA